MNFIIPNITATDQFFNIQSSYVGSKTLGWSNPIGTGNTYTTAVSFSSGVSTTPLNTTIRTPQTTTLTVKQSTSYGYPSSTFIINNPIITVGAPVLQTMPTLTASDVPQTVILDTSITNDYFYVDDQK